MKSFWTWLKLIFGSSGAPNDCQNEAREIRGKLDVPSRILSYISPITTPSHAVVIYKKDNFWYVEDRYQGKRWIGNGSKFTWEDDSLKFARSFDGQASEAAWLGY